MQHHALLYPSADLLPVELAKPGLDVVRLESGVFSIDDARSLTTLAFGKSFVEGGKRDIVIVTSSIRFEAQNALLKLFEEPPASTIFHLVLTDTESLLPTLRSRFLRVEGAGGVTTSVTFDEFIAHSYKDRLALIVTELAKDDSSWPKDLLAGFGVALQSGTKFRQYYPVHRFLTAHLNGPGASNKMLLEYFALSLPRLN
jgi:hypothetical protein